MRTRFLQVFIVVLSFLLLVLTGCSSGKGSGDAAAADTTAASDTGLTAGNAGDDGKDDDEEDEDGEDDPVPVDVAVLQRGPIEAVIRASANLEAESQVRVVGEAVGRVRELKVEEGNWVKRGQILLRLRDDEQRSLLAKAESNLEKARRELDRQKALQAQDLSSDRVLNDAQYAFDQETIAFDDAKRQLAYTVVRAPISGTVTSRMVNLGDQVQIGQELFEIIDFESLVARIYIPEKNLNEMEVGQKTRVTCRALSEEPFSASVLRISPVVDPRTGTIKVTVAVDLHAGIRPGLFADVELVTQTHDNALLVPKRALVYDNDQTFVFRIGEEQKVERLLVEPVLSDRFFVEPLAGLAEGDSVVIAGQTGLKDGVKVENVGRRDAEASEDEGEDGGASSDLSQDADSQ